MMMNLQVFPHGVRPVMASRPAPPAPLPNRFGAGAVTYDHFRRPAVDQMIRHYLNQAVDARGAGITFRANDYEVKAEHLARQSGRGRTTVTHFLTRAQELFNEGRRAHAQRYEDRAIHLAGHTDGRGPVVHYLLSRATTQREHGLAFQAEQYETRAEKLAHGSHHVGTVFNHYLERAKTLRDEGHTFKAQRYEQKAEHLAVFVPPAQRKANAMAGPVNHPPDHFDERRPEEMGATMMAVSLPLLLISLLGRARAH
jgi:hypothetical protein